MPADAAAPPLVHELVPVPDPIALCERLAGRAHRLLLDSAADVAGLGAHSFLSADPVLVLESRDGQAAWRDRRTGAVEPVEGDPLLALRAMIALQRRDAVAGLPPFQGGFAGFVAYEYGRRLEPTVPAAAGDRVGVPDVALGLYDWTVAWDHRAGRAWVVSTGAPEVGAAAEARARARLAEVLGWLGVVGRESDRPPAGDAVGGVRHPGAAGRSPAARGAPPYREDARFAAADRHHHVASRTTDAPTPAPAPPADFTRDEYLAAVDRVRAWIRAGDVFQVNLAQQWAVPLPPAGDATTAAWAYYRRLRERVPAPFAAWLELGGVAVASASPERFLRVDDRGRCDASPIKGTRPRGQTPDEDRALADELLASEKDRAENAMIADLLRNDLSRACRPGTVRLTRFCALESHARVHHLVSTVEGTLADGEDAVTLLRACFPGGSITGAPKVRAMQVVAELEPHARGVYCGAIGYLALTGAMDTSIAIRTATVRDGVAHLAAGGGITLASEPAAEYEESLLKAAALLEAVEGGRSAMDDGRSGTGPTAA